MAKKNWIAGALGGKSSHGKLHRELGVPSGKPIPAEKMAKAAKSSNPKIRRQVALAHTLESFHK
jgi:hypothetical protein